MRLLSTDRGVRERVEAYYADKLRLMLAVLGAGLALALILQLGAAQEGLLTEGYFLPRKEKAYAHRLTLRTEEGEAESYTVEVEPRELTAEECRALLQETAAGMESLILGENASLQEVRSDRNLVQEIEGTPVTVEW